VKIEFTLKDLRRSQIEEKKLLENLHLMSLFFFCNF
jgi:hypothetical protein